jgi:LacI family sucrose operon transcriptional repressor
MATIKDVAKLAGVSVTTVSRTFNNRGYIADATREKIDKACKELNYRPNELARSLFNKKSYTIGIIVPKLDSEFFSVLTQKIENQLFKKGYKMMICCTNGDIEKEKSYFDVFQSQRVDGVIVGSYLLEENFKYTAYEMPMVAFDRYLEGNIPCVGSDHYETGRLATEKLINSGCKKIAHIRGTASVGGPVHEKTVAFVETCKKAGIDYYIVEQDIKNDRKIEFDKAMEDFEKNFPDYEGIFLADKDAAYYLQYAHGKGIRVPEDVQMVGFDNIPLCQLTYPSITTVAQNFDCLSERLVDTLLKAIEVEGDYDEIGEIDRCPVELMERGSTVNRELK